MRERPDYGGMIDDRVTIFMPVRHFHAGFLRQAVASVFAQTRTDWKLLIVGDPAEGGHFRQVLADEISDPRVRVIDREGRRLAGAYNSAMRSADTEFIAALLGDDMLAPNAVEVLGKHIRSHPATDFFHSGRYFIDANNVRVSSEYLPRSSFTNENFWKMSPVKHLLCWRRSMGLACGGVDETLDNFGSDDLDFPWSMFEHGAVFTAIPHALYVFRDHRDGYRLTTHVTRDVQLNGLRRILEKHGTPPAVVAARLRYARRTYLRQSLFRSPLHRWIMEKMGFNANAGWHESYR